MSVYDPLGLLACWLIRARILLQDLWKLNLDWDESVPDELMPRWNNWLADLAEINTVRVKRHIFEQDVVEEVELHTFTDASNVVYGAVVYGAVIYYRWIDSSTKKSCVRLMMARTRVAPLKVFSVPRQIASRCVGSEIGSPSEEKLIEDREELYFQDRFDQCSLVDNSRRQTIRHICVKSNRRNSRSN